jgi:curved DNA-binding protein CbpA
MSDLYAALGVRKSATDAEIKAAYRKRAKKVHPDAGGIGEEAAQLNRAYMVLKNPQTREYYDRTGEHPDRSALDDHDAQSYATIAAHVMQALTSPYGGEIDLVREVKKKLESDRQTLRNETSAGAEIIKRTQKSMKKIKGKDADVLKRICQTYCNDVQRRIDMLNTQAGIIERAQELIKDCSWEEMAEKTGDLNFLMSGGVINTST